MSTPAMWMSITWLQT